MTRFYKHLVEVGLLMVAVTAGTVVLTGVARGEAPGCANNTCKQIYYYYNCSLGAGFKYEYDSCLKCAAPSGRCDSGQNIPCNQTDTDQGIALTEVTNVCDCDKGVGTEYVEATGNYTGSYTATGSKRWICQGSAVVIVKNP
jgi:hypothetical protein